MSYKIHVRVYQTKPSAYYNLVEKGVWHFAKGGTWTVCEEQHLLKMGGSGTSGTLRFASAADDADAAYFTVALGVHNYKPWVDIVVDQPSSDTCVHTHPGWYVEGTGKAKVRWALLTKMEKKDKKGTCVTAQVVKSAGHEYWVHIIIG